MDTLSRRICTIGIMLNAAYMGITYFTRSFFTSLGETKTLGNAPNSYLPSITNDYFYDILRSTSITLELALIVSLTLMFSLAFIRIYKNKDKSATIYSIILLIFMIITNIIIHLGFSLIKGMETYNNLALKGIMPIISAILYTILISALYMLTTKISKKKSVQGDYSKNDNKKESAK